MDEAAHVWRQLAWVNLRAEVISISEGLSFATEYLLRSSVLAWIS
jgi:hypothetical protein